MDILLIYNIGITDTPVSLLNIPKLMDKQKQSSSGGQQVGQQNRTVKRLIILFPLTIPASGKSTIFSIIQKHISKKYNLKIVSSDLIRSLKMNQLMQQHPDMLKKQAYLKTKNAADNQFFRQLDDFMTTVQKQNNTNNIVLFDKNYSQYTLPDAINQIQTIISNHKGLQIQYGFLFPQCNNNQLISIQGSIQYPFSYSYVSSCMRRVIKREKHQTLQGTIQHRVGTCLGWANCFRNFNPMGFSKTKANSQGNTYNIKNVLSLGFTKQQQVPKQIKQDIKTILCQSQPNEFSEHSHPLMPQLISRLRQWNYQQITFKQGGLPQEPDPSAEAIIKKLSMFLQSIFISK